MATVCDDDIRKSWESFGTWFDSVREAESRMLREYGHLEMKNTWLLMGGEMTVSVRPVPCAPFLRPCGYDDKHYMVVLEYGRCERIQKVVSSHTVECLLFEPLSRLKWVPSSKRSNMIVCDGEFWSFDFLYNDTKISVGGHCYYPDKYQAIRDGILRVVTWLVTETWQPRETLFDEFRWLHWTRMCRLARADAWHDYGYHKRDLLGFRYTIQSIRRRIRIKRKQGAKI